MLLQARLIRCRGLNDTFQYVYVLMGEFYLWPLHVVAYPFAGPISPGLVVNGIKFGFVGSQVEQNDRLGFTRMD